MSSIFGRQVVVPLTNKSGGGVIAGDVVVIDTTNNDAFTTTTSAATTNVVGVVQETIANNATGRVLISGHAQLVNVNASVTRGNYGATHTVAKQAADAGASRTGGTFCKFLTGGTTPDAVVFGADLGGGGSGSITASGYTQNTARLLGRTTASTGAIEEITVGSGLSLSAGSLTATGGASVSVQRDVNSTANVTIPNDYTNFTDVLSATYAAGTWVFWASTLWSNASSCALVVRLRDTTGGTNIVEADYGNQGIPAKDSLISLSGTIVLGGSSTIKIQAKANAGGGTMMYASGNGQIAIMGLKIA